MADAPRFGTPNAMYLLGRGRCPECKPDGGRVEDAAKLEPADGGGSVCPNCGETYILGGPNGD